MAQAKLAPRQAARSRENFRSHRSLELEQIRSVSSARSQSGPPEYLLEEPRWATGSQKFPTTRRARATELPREHFGAMQEGSTIPKNLASPHQRSLPSEKFSAVGLAKVLVSGSERALALKLISASPLVLVSGLALTLVSASPLVLVLASKLEWALRLSLGLV